MRYSICILALASLCVVVSSPVAAKAPRKSGGSAASANPDYKFVKAAYDYRNYGYVNRDCNRIYTYTTPDFIFVDGGGKHSKTQCVQSAYSMLTTLYQIHRELSKQMPTTQTITRTTEIRSFAASSNRIVLIEAQTVHVSATAGEGNSQATSVGDRLEGVYQDRWIRGPQGWLQQSSRKIQ